nr:F-box protein PP2-B10-like [Ziziphus jujuba var. spinosa]
MCPKKSYWLKYYFHGFILGKEIKKVEITQLPEECISHIISFTSPRDACRLSLVCPLFRSAIDSDVVWRKFLPHDYHQILSNSAFASSMDPLSKKQLFLHLSDNSIIIDSDKNMSFKIDKESGKKCFMIGARTLSIAWGDTLAYWRWISLPAESRFSRVAELRHIWWLDIKGRIKTNLLSPKSTYGAYFVYKLKEPNWAIKEIQVEFRVYFEGEEEVHEHVSGCKVFLDPSEDEQEPCKVREDGWLEVEMGEFFNDGGEDHRVVVCSLMETVFCKSGLVVEGIEFRPKLGS